MISKNIKECIYWPFLKYQLLKECKKSLINIVNRE